MLRPTHFQDDRTAAHPREQMIRLRDHRRRFSSGIPSSKRRYIAFDRSTPQSPYLSHLAESQFASELRRAPHKMQNPADQSGAANRGADRRAHMALSMLF